MEAGDTVSYLYDGWGGDYTYNPNMGIITSQGGGKYTMTVKIADDTMQLRDNVITGSFLDVYENPPGVASNSYEVRLYYNNPPAHATMLPPGQTYAVANPTGGGSYEIALHPSDPLAKGWDVPIGIKKMVAIIPGETLTRYVTIAPRSHVVADFKFTRSFGGGLKMVGDPTVSPDGKNLLINLTNTRTQDDTVSWLSFLPTSASLYVKDGFHIGSDNAGFPLAHGKGPGDTIRFTASVVIAPDDLIEVYFAGFYDTPSPTGSDTTMIVTGNTFKFRFSDGSQITVKP